MVQFPLFLLVLVFVTTISGILAQVLSGYTTIQITLGVFLMGATTITAINAIVVELYPTQIRGMALAISLMFGRIGAMIGTNVVGPLMYTYCDYMFYIFAAIHAGKYSHFHNFSYQPLKTFKTLYHTL